MTAVTLGSDSRHSAFRSNDMSCAHVSAKDGELIYRCFLSSLGQEPICQVVVSCLSLRKVARYSALLMHRVRFLGRMFAFPSVSLSYSGPRRSVSRCGSALLPRPQSTFS